eukprot:GHVH01001431.1.p1 GENE.GHVH01001431.1~~GHVH01001431.1.p1  ORF type:complete len:985 (-),score=183.01 GHVH01001431.1:71-3025(-)
MALKKRRRRPVVLSSTSTSCASSDDDVSFSKPSRSVSAEIERAADGEPESLSQILSLSETGLSAVLEKSLIMGRALRSQSVRDGRKGGRKQKPKNLPLKEIMEFKIPPVRWVPFTAQPSIVTGGKLKPYQVDGVRWLINLIERGLNGILADEMGLGKTFQSICLIAYMLEVKKIKQQFIILVPKSTVGNWVNEFKRFTPTIKVSCFQGTREVRHAMKPKLHKSQVIITSFEICMKEIDFLKTIPFHILIIDEAHRIKNDASKLSSVSRAIDAQYRLLLTGTPLQNNLKELWSLLNFLFPHVFGSAEEFEEVFDLSGGDNIDNLTPDQLDEKNALVVGKLHQILRPFMLRRSKSEVMGELPPKKEMLLYVPMSELQKDLYRNLLTKNLEVINEGGQRVTKLLNLCMELRKVCNHPYLFPGAEAPGQDPYGDHLISNAGKMVIVDRLCQRLIERGSRVLIFSQMTRVLDILDDWCRMRGYERCRIDGSSKDREEQIERFMTKDDVPIFLLSTRAGGLGINLVKADVVILYDSDWNPQQDLQAMDRCHRIGQVKPVSVYRLIHEHTVEQKIIERANLKLQLDRAIIKKGGQASEGTLSKKEILTAVQHGAAEILNSGRSIENLTEDDFSRILSQASKIADDLEQKVAKEIKKSILDFSGINGSRMDALSTMFENNIDSEKADVDAIKRLLDDKRRKDAKEVSDLEKFPSKRRRLVHHWRDADGQSNEGLRHPASETEEFYDFQLIDRDRLQTISDRRNELMEDGASEDDVRWVELERERLEVIGEGFQDWSRSDFARFIKSLELFGRCDLESIEHEFEGENVCNQLHAYASKFWSRGPKEISDFKKINARIESGESALERKRAWEKVAQWKVDQCDPCPSDPDHKQLGSMWIHSWSQSSVRKLFSEAEDRWIIYMISRIGYGEWDRFRIHSRQAVETKYDWHLRSRTTYELGRRAEMLVRHVKKEMITKKEDNRVADADISFIGHLD